MHKITIKYLLLKMSHECGVMILKCTVTSVGKWTENDLKLKIS